MKIKNIAGLVAAAWLSAQTGLLAQTAASPQPQISAADAATEQALAQLVQQVQSKVKAGKRSEADLADELKTLDTLIAGEKGAKTDEAARIVYMKALLYLQIIKDEGKATEIVKQMKRDYPDTHYGKSADTILAGMAAAAGAKKIQDSLTAGSVFPDFAETDLDGKALSVESRKGKVLLLDFWATWCPPCRAELPNVIATYQKHHGEGFEIIGVSLDDDRAKLNAFLKQTDGMTWPQYFDGQRWTNNLAVKYGVQAIPFAVLIDPDGKIIGKNLRGEDLENAVAKAVAKPTGT